MVAQIKLIPLLHMVVPLGADEVKLTKENLGWPLNLPSISLMKSLTHFEEAAT